MSCDTFIGKGFWDTMGNLISWVFSPLNDQVIRLGEATFVQQHPYLEERMKHLERIWKGRAAMALGAALITGSLAITMPGANALSGSCEAWIESGIGYSVGAGRCSALGWDTKARVTLDVALAPDRHSEWFYDINTTYRTAPWYPSVDQGWPRSARVDHAPR